MHNNLIPQVLLNYTLKHEGGFINHPLDAGGATNFGITRLTYRKYINLILKKDKEISIEDIKNINLKTVEDIYSVFYYIPSKANEIYNLNFKNLACKYFDMCVNLGQGKACLILKQAFNLKKESNIADIISTLKTIKTEEKQYFEEKIIDSLCNLLTDYYNDKVKEKPNQKIFLNGWLKRAKTKPNIINIQNSSCFA
jgi:lysozyme family protein